MSFDLMTTEMCRNCDISIGQPNLVPTQLITTSGTGLRHPSHRGECAAQIGLPRRCH